MGDEQEKFSVILELVSKRFSKDIDEAEKKLNKIDNEKHVEIQVDAKRVPQEFKKFFNQYNALAKKMSTMNIWEKLTNDNGLRANQYGRFFNDIRSDAVDAIEQIEREAPELQIRIFTSQENIDNIEKSIEELEHKRDLAEGRMKKWKTKMEVAVEFNPTEIQAKLDEAQKGLHKAELEGMTIPDWKTDEKAANQEQITAYKKQIDDLTKQLQNPPDMSKLEKNFDRAAKQVELCTEKVKDLKMELATLQKSNASDTKRFNDIKTEYAKIIDDIQQNPLNVKLESKTLSKYNKPSLELKETWHGINKEISRANILSRMQGKVIQRMMSQIAYWINPLNLFVRSWSKWLDQNQEVKNTFEVISYNLVRVIAPLMEAFANSMLKIAQYANVFTKSWLNVDLFDRTKKDADEAKKKVDSVTASFDELHDVNKDKNENKNTLADLGTLPPINESLKESLTNFANNNKWIGNALTWAMKHPIETAALALGAKFVAGLVGKGIGKLVGKGISKLFGGSAAKAAASAGGATVGGIFGKALYTGMSGQAITVGKLLGGITLTAGGTALAISQAADAGKNWQDLTAGTKAAKVGMVGLGSAAAGLGAIMLGASGPVGWAVAGTVALTSFVVGMAKTQDGLKSVKKETEKLAEAQNNAKIANDNYLIATNNLASTMSSLEQLERQTGLSGAELDKQVRSGRLEVDKMTSSQILVYNAYLQNQEALKQMKEVTEAKIEADKQEVIQSLKVEAVNAVKAKSYDTLREKVVKAWQDGSISAEEGADIMSRALASADKETQRTFGESIPNEMKNAFNPEQYESGWRKFSASFKNAMNGIGDWFKDKWNGVKKWWNGLWSKDNMSAGGGAGRWPEAVAGGRSLDVPSYDVGTNYVPNDQLAMVHKGEAIIPAKYNRPNIGNNSSGLYQVIDNMTNEIGSLRSLIQQGIPVTGQFTQRGSDLVAVVDKASSRRGTQPISNPAYAR